MARMSAVVGTPARASDITSRGSYTATDLFGHGIREQTIQGEREDGGDERTEALERLEEGRGGAAAAAGGSPGDGEPGGEGGGA